MIALDDNRLSREKLEEYADGFLAALSRRYDLPELTWAKGACLVDFGGGNLLTVYPELESLRSLILHAPVGVLPLESEKTGAFLLEMAIGNNCWTLTQGATVGLDPEDGTVSLWQRFVLPPAGDEEIWEAVEALLGTAEHWRGILERHDGAALFSAAGEGSEAAGEGEANKFIVRA
jgi:hypothetical protein